LSINDKIPIKANNEGLDKYQPSLSNQQDMISNSIIPQNELRHISSYIPGLIINNPFERTKTRALLRNISGQLFICFSNRT
jgi:hypothetical protein